MLIMSRKQPGLKIARELATRLDSAFGSNAIILYGSPGCWSPRRIEQKNRVLDPLMNEPLKAFDTTSNRPLVVRHAEHLIAIAKTGEYYGETIVVGCVLPDQNENLVCSLISGHLEALQQRDAAETADVQINSFIEQVTQDFEELTWLRNTYEFLDVCNSNQTVAAIARTCLPDLAHVIRAESILFIPSKVDRNSEAVIADWECAIATGKPLADSDEYHRFLNESMPFMDRGPRVVNVCLSQQHIPEIPRVKNCVAISVSKREKVFGWIMAINRIPSELEAEMQKAEDSQGIVPSFGTFEAGLMSAAASIMSSHALNLELFEAQESLTIGVVRAIINAIDAKDAYTCGHSDRVAMYAKMIATRLTLGTEECERIYMAGLLHDVGKIGIPDSILGKPAKLTDEEYTIVKKHPEIGHSILKHLSQLSYVLPGVLYHHEAVNGTGYPAGLIGEEIPLHGRILAVADAYDAMTSNRPYRAGMPSEKAESILRAESGKTWDPDIVTALFCCLENGDIQPHSTGSIEPSPGHELNTDSIASLMNRIGNSINSMAVG